jgi:hypothetical protein
MSEYLPKSPEQREKKRLEDIIIGIVELNDWFYEAAVAYDKGQLQGSELRGSIADGFERVAQHCEAVSDHDPELGAALITAFEHRPDLDLHHIAVRLRERRDNTLQ